MKDGFHNRLSFLWKLPILVSDAKSDRLLEKGSMNYRQKSKKASEKSSDKKNFRMQFFAERVMVDLIVKTLDQQI